MLKIFLPNLMCKRHQLLVIIAAMLCTLLGCASTREHEPSSSLFDNQEELRKMIMQRDPSIDTFSKPGPFSYTVSREFGIRISKQEIVDSDVYLPVQTHRSPLIILQHGNLANKGAHEKQARRLASWGFNVIVLEQPNQYRWIKNGEVLGKLVELLYRWPGMLNDKFDPHNIIIVGHSFGGSAVAIAASGDSPIKGLIFLDPALFNKRVMQSLSAIKKPAVLLGADPGVFKSRKRDFFYKLIPKDIIEISIKGATHNDAQFPSQFSLGEKLGFRAAPSEKKQELFLSSLVTAAFSLTAPDFTDYAWKAYRTATKAGSIYQLQRK